MGQVATLTDPPSTSDDVVASAFAPAEDLPAALAYTRSLALGHYENFSVVSMLLPRHLRQDFCNIYAFCRTADDLGDETGDCTRALELLSRFKGQTRDCYAGKTSTAIFIALRDTITRHDIPIEPFLDLIDAFEQDQRVKRYETFESVVDYCRRSANPVGRLVLYVCGYRDAQRQELSDKTCTALQLANFWQDVRRDLLNLDRIYLPLESLRKFGLTEAELIEQIHHDQCDQRFRDMLHAEVDRAEAMFVEGEQLLPLLDASVRGQVALFGQGGRAILQSIRRQEYDTVSRRPELSKRQKSRLILSAVIARCSPLRVLRRGA